MNTRNTRNRMKEQTCLRALSRFRRNRARDSNSDGDFFFSTSRTACRAAHVQLRTGGWSGFKAALPIMSAVACIHTPASQEVHALLVLIQCDLRELRTSCRLIQNSGASWTAAAAAHLYAAYRICVGVYMKNELEFGVRRLRTIYGRTVSRRRWSGSGSSSNTERRRRHRCIVCCCAAARLAAVPFGRIGAQGRFDFRLLAAAAAALTAALHARCDFITFTLWRAAAACSSMRRRHRRRRHHRRWRLSQGHRESAPEESGGPPVRGLNYARVLRAGRRGAGEHIRSKLLARTLQQHRRRLLARHDAVNTVRRAPRC